MTTVDGILAMIDERAAALTQFRDAAVRVHAVFGPSFWVSEHEVTAAAVRAMALPSALPAAVPPPALAARSSRSTAPRSGRPVRTVARVGKGRPPLDLAAVDAVVLAAVEQGLRQGKAIAAQTKIHVLGVRAALQRLVDAGRVTRHGTGAHTQYTRPGGAPTARTARPRPSEKTAAREAEVLAWLERQTAPVAPGAVAQACPDVSAVTVRAVLGRLIASGAVLARGNTTTRQIGVPRVMGAPAGETRRRPRGTAPPPRETPAVSAATAEAAGETAPTAGDGLRLAAEITRVMKTGLSYEPKELLRNIRPAVPTVTLGQIVAACDAQVPRHLERIRISERITRYRALPRAKQEAIA